MASSRSGHQRIMPGYLPRTDEQVTGACAVSGPKGSDAIVLIGIGLLILIEGVAFGL
jgi:hypothetical protein